jgi:RNA polymerase sigma-70 factor (ECF subfamily)
MDKASFLAQFQTNLRRIFDTLRPTYQVTVDEFAEAVYATATKYLWKNGNTIANNEIQDFIEKLYTQDLCLALACAAGNELAWEDFMRDYRPFLQAIARQIGKTEQIAEDLVSQIWTDLYGLREVAGQRQSKFYFYSGRGSLKGWLKTVVFQLFVERHRQSNRYVQPDEETGFERLAPTIVPEIKIQEHQYVVATQQALGVAFEKLDTKLKLLLSYYYYDQLTLKQIGALFQVHEATASRWLQRAQQDVRQLMEQCLKEQYHYNNVQIAECLQLAATGEAVSVASLLGRQNSEESGNSPHPGS